MSCDGATCTQLEKNNKRRECNGKKTNILRKQNQQKIIIEHGLVAFYTGTKLQQTGKVNERLTGLRGKKTKRNSCSTMLHSVEWNGNRKKRVLLKQQLLQIKTSKLLPLTAAFKFYLDLTKDWVSLPWSQVGARVEILNCRSGQLFVEDAEYLAAHASREIFATFRPHSAEKKKKQLKMDNGEDDKSNSLLARNNNDGVCMLRYDNDVSLFETMKRRAVAG